MTRTAELLDRWIEYQKHCVAAADGDATLVADDLDAMAYHVLLGLWSGRAVTWARLARRAGVADPEETSEELAVATTAHVAAGRISPAVARGMLAEASAVVGRETWQVALHTPQAATISRDGDVISAAAWNGAWLHPARPDDVPIDALGKLSLALAAARQARPS